VEVLDQVQAVTPFLGAIVLLALGALVAFQAALAEGLGPTSILRIYLEASPVEGEELVVVAEILSNRKKSLLEIVSRCKQRFLLWRRLRARAKR
jgi:hypothetical protein